MRVAQKRKLYGACPERECETENIIAKICSSVK